MTDRRVEVFSGFISGLLGRFQSSRRLRRRRLKQVQHEHQYAECLETRTLLSAVNISVDTNVASEESGNVVTVTATAVEAVSGDQTITVTVSGDGITDGDLTFLNQSITIADGETIGTVTFTANDDGVLEINETATLTLSDFSAGVSAGATVSTNVTIVDNKQEVVTLDNVDQYPGSQPTLSWQTVAGAARYELWFSRVSPAASRIISDTQIAMNSYTIQDNLAAGSVPVLGAGI